jgi:hypothetical protein
MLCQNQTDIPTEPHYAIIKFSTVHIPGDERSQRHPGHGYGAEDRPVSHYYAFTDRKEWVAEIEKLAADRSYSPPRFIAIVAHPAQVRTEVVVNLQGIAAAEKALGQTCPECGGTITSQERSPTGFAWCAQGHRWKPSESKQRNG